jgi:glucokinase
MAKLYLGIDLGGTVVKLAIVDSKGNIIEQHAFDNSDHTPAVVVKQIVAHYKTFSHKLKLSGTGIGVAGDIDQDRGIVRFSPNLGWKNLKLKNMLAKYLPAPISMDNDANAAAWGAFWLETKGLVKNMVCVTLGTGVGGGIICNGDIMLGATGTAGEIGHMTFDPTGPRCNCGNYGCIERYVGAQYLSDTVRERILKGERSQITELVNTDYSAITPEIITIAAKNGDKLATSIWREAGERLGIMFASIINALNPEMIVLAGGVSKSGDLIMKPIKETVKKRAFKTPAQACKIVFARNTQHLGVTGAALLAAR